MENFKKEILSILNDFLWQNTIKCYFFIPLIGIIRFCYYEISGLYF
jgi:hypothetical protein